MFRLQIVCLLCAGLIFSACSSMKGRMEKPADLLIQAGISAYEEGDYQGALDNFEQLKNWYPFSKYAILAELKIADSHYHLRQYQEAIAAYEDFERLHPRNEAVAYVIYQIGRCHFEQMDAIDRDQTAARKALETFRRFVNQYPNDPYAPAAHLHIDACLKSLAGHDYYIASFYLKARHYNAAMHRFLAIVKNYPDAGLHRDALLHIAKCRAYLEAAGQETESAQRSQP